YSVPKPHEAPDAYIQSLIAIIVSEKIDWLIPTCEELFFVARALEHLKQHCFVLVDSLTKLRCLHSKWDFINRARAHGFVVPVTHLITSLEEAKTVLSSSNKWVFKPV